MKTNILRIILILTLSNLTSIGSSQGWTKTYGRLNDDEAYSVQQTFDGGYIITGSTIPTNSLNSALYLIKTNGSGDTTWTKTYGRPGLEYGVDVKQTTDKGFIICGYYAGVGPLGVDITGGFNSWLLKTDSNGDTLWTNNYGGAHNDYVNSVFQADDGGYVIIGSTRSYGAGDFDYWILKTNASGDSLWSTTYGSFYYEIASEAQATSDGGYIIAGTKQIQENADIWLLKIYSNGEEEWSQTYGGDYNDVAYSVQETADAGFIVSGYTRSFGSGGDDVYLIKTDMYGDTIWTKTYGGLSNDGGTSVIETAEGDFIVCGYTMSYSVNGDMDLWLIKTDIGGYTLWKKTYGGSGGEIGFAVIEAFDGGLTACGSTTSYGAGQRDVWLLHSDLNGTVGMTDHPSSNSTGYKLGQNYPNPFSGATTIEYFIPTSGIVSVKVYDLSGRYLETLMNEYQQNGNHSIRFDGHHLQEGIYYYRLQSAECDLMKMFVKTK